MGKREPAVKKEPAVTKELAVKKVSAVKKAPSSSSRSALEEEYLQLMKNTLPALAAKHRWPIRWDHCFMRVALDNAFGSCWYDHVDRKEGPAIRQISDAAMV